MTSRLPDTGTPLPADGELRALIERLAEAAAERKLKAMLQDLPGPRPKFTTLSRAARTLGLGVSTLRRKARASGVQRQPGGRYLFAELEAAAAGERVAPPAPKVSDLAAERARRAAASLAERPRGPKGR